MFFCAFGPSARSTRLTPAPPPLSKSQISPAAMLRVEVNPFFATTYINRHDGFVGAPVHDVCAVLALTHPDLFTRHTAYVVVETGGPHTRGMTVVDLRTLKDRPAPNVELLMSIDEEAGFQVILDAVASFP